MENDLITEKNMISEILKRNPGFVHMFEKACDYWKGEDFPVGLQLEEFTDFVFQEIKKDNSRQAILENSFSTIEELLEVGNEIIRNYIYFMFLESLINILANNNFDYKIIEPYLGPLSRKAYDRINAFWMEGTPIDSLD